MNRTGRVGDCAFGEFAGALHGGDTGPQITKIVQGVEDAENVHASLGGLVYEAFDDAIFIVPVTQQVLTAQQHLQTGFRQQLAESPQALPGIFIQKADTGIKGGASPALQ